ncbi:hypothetical protein D1872_279040 [compost metagenome]
MIGHCHNSTSLVPSNGALHHLAALRFGLTGRLTGDRSQLIAVQSGIFAADFLQSVVQLVGCLQVIMLTCYHLLTINGL